jgi:hypothetical protein
MALLALGPSTALLAVPVGSALADSSTTSTDSSVTVAEDAVLINVLVP